MNHGDLRPAGALGLEVTRAGETFSIDPREGLPPLLVVEKHPQRELTLTEVIRYGAPQAGLHPMVNRWRRRNLPNLWRGARRVFGARALDIPTLYGSLWLTLHSALYGDLDLGLASMRVVTTAGVNYIVADIAAGANDSNLFKFHGIGTGTTAEASSDTALVTELTTEYATDSTRPTGSQGTGGSSNVYRTAATITPDSGGTLAITEHGIFTQAATGGGTLLDRSKFAAVNLVTPNDSITPTYDLTLAAGG